MFRLIAGVLDRASVPTVDALIKMLSLDVKKPSILCLGLTVEQVELHLLLRIRNSEAPDEQVMTKVFLL
jgi:hypothetical protein